MRVDGQNFGMRLDCSPWYFPPEEACLDHCRSFSSRLRCARTSSVGVSPNRVAVSPKSPPAYAQPLLRKASFRSSTALSYRARDPEFSPFFQLLRDRFDEFERVYPERYQKTYGYWRPIIRTSITKFCKPALSLPKCVGI
jgi:hypothetical protein